MTTITRYPPNATTPLQRNRITNPRMSTGSTAGWTASTGAGTLAYSSAVGSSLRFTTTASGVAVVETVSPAVPGEVISASVDIQPFTTNRTGLLRLYFLDASLATIGGPFDTTAAVTVGSWTTLTNNNRTAPAGTAYVRLLAGINNSAGAGQAINVTKALVMNGPSAGPYFDGDSPSAFPFFYYWEGQRGLSASRFVDVTGDPDQIHPTLGVGTPFNMSRESRSVVRPLLDPFVLMLVAEQAHAVALVVRVLADLGVAHVLEHLRDPGGALEHHEALVDDRHLRRHLLALGLARLRTFVPDLRSIGLSATVAEPDELRRWLVSQNPPQGSKKAGMAGLVSMQSGARAVLAAGGCASLDGRRHLRELERDMLRLRASPGGAADLLAATLFLDRLQHGLPAQLGSL